MSLLVLVAVVLVLLILAVYIVERMPFGDAMLKWALQAVLVLIAIVVIANRSGVI